MLLFWAAALSFAALVAIPWTYLTKDIRLLYNSCMWAAITGVRIAGVKVRTLGLEKIDPARTYVFMSNNISNLDPAPHVGDGEERTVQGSNSRPHHVARIPRACRPWQSRCGDRGGARRAPSHRPGN